MGNRISDIGKIRNVSGEKRLRLLDGKKPAKLGTEKNPAVVSVQTEARFKEVTSAFEEKGWKYRIELEPDKPEDIADLARSTTALRPKTGGNKARGNEPSP